MMHGKGGRERENETHAAQRDRGEACIAFRVLILWRFGRDCVEIR